MLRRSGRATQLAWNLYALSPWASFDYVPLPFIAVSKSEFAIVGRVGRRGGKKKVFNLQEVQRFSLNKHKNFQRASEFLELAKLCRLPRELLCRQDLGLALWPEGRAEIMRNRVRKSGKRSRCWRGEGS